MLPEHPGSRAMPLALISPWHFIFHFVYFHLWALFFQTKTSSHHFLFFWGKVLLCGSNWPGTYLDQGDLELREPPAFVSWVLRLKVCTSYLVFTLLNLYSSHYRHLAPWLLLSVYAHCVGSCEWTSTWRPLVNLMSFSQSHHFFFFLIFILKFMCVVIWLWVDLWPRGTMVPLGVEGRVLNCSSTLFFSGRVSHKIRSSLIWLGQWTLV